MDTVDGIARRNAEKAVMAGLTELSVAFTCKEGWINVVTRHFMGALVGTRCGSTYTADQIRDAFDRAMRECTYTPKPVDVARFALAQLPPPPMQKLHNDPLPTRRWTDAERAANIAKIDAMQAFLTAQEPEFRRALDAHGYGTPGLLAVQEKHRAELQTFIQNNA